MQRYITKIILFTSFVYLSSIGQITGKKDPASNYYPLSQNDYWEYLDYEWMGVLWDTLGVSVDSDTILDGKSYHKIITRWLGPPGSSTAYQRIDSTGDVYLFNETLVKEEILYRLSDTTKTYWNRAAWKVRFDSVYIAEVFGLQRKILPVYYYDVDDSLCISPLIIEKLCEGIGLISTYVTESHWTEIRGCYVSGSRYGDIMAIDNEGHSSKISFHLDQNFPNPFNGSTAFNYEIMIPTHVDLSLYDISGQKVQTLISEIEPGGKHSLIWTPANLASGIYLVKLQTGAFSMIRKIIYLK